MKKVNLKKLLILNVPYLLIGAVATNLGEAWRIADGTNMSEKLQSMVTGGAFGIAFSNPIADLKRMERNRLQILSTVWHLARLQSSWRSLVIRV